MGSLTIQNVKKAFGQVEVLKGIDLEVQDGEFVVFVGPSGCGKSTLLRIIAGLEDSTSGSVLIDGQRVDAVPPARRGIAMVFQTYALYPHLTVYENIAFPLRLAKRPEKEIDEKVREASKTLDLDEHLQRKPANLSGGQRQRVAMGRAIVREAKAFLFDEPLSNLDAKLRGQMRTEIARLQKRLGITTVYVTHDQTEAMTLGDRVAVMKRGVLQQLATPRELYEQPVNLFVAGFIGSPPMNFLPATVEGDQVTLPFGTFSIPQAKAEKTAGKGLLMAGIRPEHFEDVSVLEDSKVDSSRTFKAHIDVREWLGDQQYAYVPYEAEAKVQDQLKELARESDTDSLRTQLVVSLDAASTVKEDDDATLFIDTDKMHLFDPTSGDNLTVGL